MNGKVSVIVPIYKVEKYLSKCIESIINQSYSNLEIILINDGSPDNCGNICDAYSRIDNRIQVIHKKNGGLSDARNEGLKIASGEYISFIDSDDYIDKDFYKILIDLIRNSNADAAQCSYKKITENGNLSYKNDILEDKNDENISLHNLDILNSLYGNEEITVIWNVWNKLYKRELLRDIYFPKGKLHEDVFTTYKILYRAKMMVSTNKQLYFYTQRASSIMGRFNVKHLDVLEAYVEQVYFYDKKGLKELKRRAANILEITIKASIVRVLNSNINDKEQILDNLINFYKRNTKLFDRNNRNLKQNILYILIKISPSYLIKSLYRFSKVKKQGYNSEKSIA
ncbi:MULTISPECIES: glycosyltransferase [Bacillaceae]|uniref:glycosyltransferase n=1 Tax=Bacillaceae TaxID=186817 RepID=UPI00065FA43C|nr:MULTISPECIES: glycosyltransferase [Bacillaceae]MCF2649149.1 glycosyltransferase [Niallia circulans]